MEGAAMDDTGMDDTGMDDTGMDDTGMDDTGLEDVPGVEVERIRALVGPSEIAYADLLRDREESQRIARDALAEVGELRGQIEEMSVQLARARQDQDVLLKRASMTEFGQIADRVTRRWRTSVTPRLAKLLPHRGS